MAISRRTFLRGAAASMVSVPLAVRGQVAGEPLFRHGVASGDPLADRVVLWTRLTQPPERSAIGPIAVGWQVATDDQLTRIVAHGSVSASPARDFTVKVDAAGLEPGRAYFYAFVAGGQRSPVGRTRTLAARGAARVRLAVVSCSNYGTGYFNVYRCLSNRADLDAVLHLGDYIYESANGQYGAGPDAGRVAQRAAHDVTLADYRQRYAAYRSDIDLQDAHARHPFVTVWDDHELADNAWADGAAGHDARDGNWKRRQAAAYQAYLEWMPVRESTQSGMRLYRSFRAGDMADVIVLDTRAFRDRQLAPEDVARMDRGGRSILGDRQERWLFDRLRASKRDSGHWRLIAQQILFSQLNPPGAPPNPDFWEGYPAARRRVLDVLDRERVANVAILAGDLHSSWAFDVPRNPWSRASPQNRSLAIELVAPAISSVPLFGEPGVRERMMALKVRAPHLRFLDGDRNGYILLELTRERLLADWYFVATTARRSDEESRGVSFMCESGTSRLTPA
jgi:alkaline phosphatase D